MKRIGVLLFGLAVLGAPTASANITVKGTVRYWNGDVKNVDGTTGAYVPARFLHVQVENDDWTVSDIDTWTDVNGKYSVTFKQEIYRPDFKRLEINIEVRACVLLDAFKKDWAVDVENTVSAYKGAVRLYPYNGQTRSLGVNDGSTVTINVYVQGPDSPTDFGAAGAGAYNLPIQSWDYDDDGRRTVAGIFMCQACEEEYQFLCGRAADKKELSRSTSIFYPEGKSAYRETQSPVGIPKLSEGTGWIDMESKKLFDVEKPLNGTWLEWRDRRCTILHEFSHKLMHDVYWTLPKTHPWMSSTHDATSCASGEMGWREGWAQFLPAAVLKIPTMTGKPVSAAKALNAENIEHAWYPTPPGMPSPPCDDVPGFLSWRDNIKGRRDWNEIEVAAVLWDIYDWPRWWEYMPKAEQDKKPAGWPGHLEWYERLQDPYLDRIWKMVKKQPEALNDEDEWAINQDSFWTFWLKEYGNDKELVHGLKAILHNRDIRHTLKPENAPEIQKIRVVAKGQTLCFAELTVKEADTEDRPFLYYNVAYGKGTEPLKLLYTKDRPLNGTWKDDVLTAPICLPDSAAWTRLVVKVHDSMMCAFTEAGGDLWEDASAGGPSIQLVAAGHNRSAAISDENAVWVWGTDKPSYIYRSVRGEQLKFARSCANRLRDAGGFIAITAGRGHTATLRLDGTVWNWGWNTHGCLAIEGERRPSRHEAPIQVPGLSDVVAISAGEHYTLALRSNGEVWSWGWNICGKLGDGTTTDRSTPVRVAGLSNIIAIAAGTSHSLAVDKDGNVWAWGANGTGQLGDGAKVQKFAPNRLTPAKVPGIDKVKAVAAHGHRSVALKTDGTVWEWGARAGRPSSPTIPYCITSVPAKVTGLSRITAISAGGAFQVALRDDGTAWSWGDANWCGQLGCGPVKERPIDWGTARQVKDYTDFNNVIAISAGDKHGLLVRSDGSVWSWGGNEFHALGSGVTRNRPMPGRVQMYVPSGGDSYGVMAFHLFRR